MSSVSQNRCVKCVAKSMRRMCRKIDVYENVCDIFLFTEAQWNLPHLDGHLKTHSHLVPMSAFAFSKIIEAMVTKRKCKEWILYKLTASMSTSP